VSTNSQCGPAALTRCPPPQCCSQYGWCDTADAYCGAGCQAGYGACANTSSSGSSSPGPTPLAPLVGGGNATPTVSATAAPPLAGGSLTTPLPPSARVDVVTTCAVPGTVAITFDDGAYVDHAAIAAAFTAAGGRATFFLNGDNWACIYDRAEAIKAAYDAGHQIASHTWSHADMAGLTAGGVAEEMNRLTGAFRRILGAVPVMMRPPYGSYTPATVDALRQLGFTTLAMWDVDSGDSLGAGVAAQQAAYTAADTATAHIILHHETVATTAGVMVPWAIAWARARGLAMVTLAECLGPGVDAYAPGGYVAPEARNPGWVC
jgi:peptidoglycan/xylan/chitin deacetylase (PgdA/CDA1 family)